MFPWHLSINLPTFLKLRGAGKIAEGLARQCSHNSALASYVNAPWRCDNRWGVNHFIHNRDSATMCRNISRLLVGGQDLRGGDPSGGSLPTIRN